MTDPTEPIKLTETEAKGGSKTRVNRTVLFISLAIVILAFVIIFIIYG